MVAQAHISNLSQNIGDGRKMLEYEECVNKKKAKVVEGLEAETLR